MLLWEWAHGHAMAKNLEYREKGGRVQDKNEVTEANSPLATYVPLC